MKSRESDHANTPAESNWSGAVDALILDLLEWIAPKPRAYSEVMEAWRSSCPRLPVWEDANERGFVERYHQEGLGTFISVTTLGREFLEKHRPRRLTSPDDFNGDEDSVPAKLV